MKPCDKYWRSIKPIQPPSRKAQRLIKMVYSSQTTPNTQISRKVTFLEEPTETHYLVIFPVSWISKNQPEYSPVHTLPLLPHLVGTPQEGNSMVSHLCHSDIPLFLRAGLVNLTEARSCSRGSGKRLCEGRRGWQGECWYGLSHIKQLE